MSPVPEPIIIVSGLPRSGTSLMMQMLEAGGLKVLTDGERRPDDDNPRGYYELEAVKSSDASWIDTAAGKGVKVILVLLRRLPPGHQYRVILMTRDLREIVASQRRMLERGGKTGAALSGDLLQQAFEAELNRTRQWLATDDRFEILEISYNELLSHPLDSAGEVAAFVSGLDPDAMAAVVSPDLYRQRV